MRRWLAQGQGGLSRTGDDEGALSELLIAGARCRLAQENVREQLDHLMG